MGAQIGEGLVVNGEVVGRRNAGIGDRGLLRLGQVGGVLRPFERADEVLGDTGIDAGRVAHRHAAAALVVEGDAQPHEFDQARRQRSPLAQHVGEVMERPHQLGRVRGWRCHHAIARAGALEEGAQRRREGRG